MKLGITNTYWSGKEEPVYFIDFYDRYGELHMAFINNNGELRVTNPGMEHHYIITFEPLKIKDMSHGDLCPADVIDVHLQVSAALHEYTKV